MACTINFPSSFPPLPEALIKTEAVPPLPSPAAYTTEPLPSPLPAHRLQLLPHRVPPADRHIAIHTEKVLARLSDTLGFDASDQKLIELGLLYRRGQFKSQYTDSPPGKLNPLFLVEQQPAYAKVQIIDEWVKKKIVISDLALPPQHEFADAFIYELFLCALHQKGFELWALTHEGLNKITHATQCFSALQSTLRSTKFASHQEVIDSCKAHRIGTDECFWLNYRNRGPLLHYLCRSIPAKWENIPVQSFKSKEMDELTATAVLKHAGIQKTYDYPDNFQVAIDLKQERLEEILHLVKQLPPRSHVSLIISTEAEDQVENVLEAIPQQHLIGIKLIGNDSQAFSFESLKPLSTQTELRSFILDNFFIKYGPHARLSSLFPHCKQKLKELSLPWKNMEDPVMYDVLSLLDPAQGHLRIIASNPPEAEPLISKTLWSVALKTPKITFERNALSCVPHLSSHNESFIKVLTIDNRKKLIIANCVNIVDFDNEIVIDELKNYSANIQSFHCIIRNFFVENVSILKAITIEKLYLILKQNSPEADQETLQNLDQLLSFASIDEIVYDFQDAASPVKTRLLQDSCSLCNQGEFIDISHKTFTKLHLVIDPSYPEHTQANAIKELTLAWSPERVAVSSLFCSAPKVSLDFRDAHCRIEVALDSKLRSLHIQAASYMKSWKLTDYHTVRDLTLHIHVKDPDSLNHNKRTLDGIATFIHFLHPLAATLETLTLIIDADTKDGSFAKRFFKKLSSLTFPKVKELRFTDADILRADAADFIQLINQCPELDLLTCENLYLFSRDKEPPIFAKTIPLTYLDISYSGKDNDIEDDAACVFEKLLSVTPHLVYLKTPYPPSFDTFHFPYLRIASMPNMSNDEIQLLVKKAPLLETLFTTNAFLNTPLDPTLKFGRCRIYTQESSENTEESDTFSEFAFDSASRNPTFVAKEIFPGIHPRLYRETPSTVIWEEGRLISTPCKLDPTVFSGFAVNEIADAVGCVTLEITDEWQPLTGLSCGDMLCYARCKGVDQNLFEWGFDTKLSQYSIRLKEGKNALPVTIEYGIKKKPWLFEELSIPLGDAWQFPFQFTKDGINLFIENPPLSELVAYFRSFSNEDPRLIENAPFWIKINRVIEKRAGIGCEGRAQLFCFIAPLLIPGITKALVGGNHLHAYAEVCYNAEWWNIDLGGFLSHTELIPAVVESSQLDAAQATENSLLPQHHTVSQTICKGMPEEARSARDLDTFTAHILKAHHKQVLLLIEQADLPQLHASFFRHSPEDFAYLNIKQPKLVTYDVRERELYMLPNLCQKVIRHGGILFVDLTELSSSNIATLCTLTDPLKRVLQGIDLHPATTIIACLPKDAPFSLDIGRRFSLIGEVPTFDIPQTDESSNPAVSPSSAYFSDSLSDTNFDQTSEMAIEETFTIDLHGDATSWYGKLMGQLESNESPLFQSAQKNGSLLLYNPPEELAFTLFLQKLQQGYVEHKGKLVQLSLPVQIKTRHPASQELMVCKTTQHAEYVLNPATLHDFLSGAAFEGATFIPTKGILQECAGKTISLLVTHEIQPSQWAQLLETASKNSVTLHLIAPRNVRLPEYIIAADLEPNHSPLSPSIVCVEDLAYGLQQLKTEYPQALFVPVTSSTAACDLIPTVINRSECTLDFAISESDVWNALEDGKTVILYGVLSQQLFAELASLLCTQKPYIMVNGTYKPLKGKLLFVTAWSDMQKRAPTTTHTHDPKAIEQALSECYGRGKVAAASKKLEDAGYAPTFSRIQALIRYTEAGIENSLELFDTKAQQICTYTKRFEEVEKVWRVSPLVYLYGPPASGKTHFMLEMLPEKMPNHHFYFSEKNLERFLLDDSPSVLCLDEADLFPEKLETLYGLFQNPPCVLMNGKLIYPKAPKLVLLTGNAHFADRPQPSFIKEHGGALFFAELSPYILRDVVLKKLLPEKASSFLNELYTLYKTAKEENHEIDLRHLKMMCALYHLYAAENKVTSDRELAEWVFFEVWPSSLKTLREKYEALAIKRISTWLTGNQHWTSGFYLTNSRKLILARLLTLFQLRQEKGSGYQQGIVLEGAAGEGKTALVQALLTSLGLSFTKVALTDDPEKVRRLLENAFHEGHTVVIDEFDGKYETECNAYLTGIDLTGKRAKQPGFLLIGTANGSDYHYRLPRSPALDSRLQVIQIPPYTREELIEILCAKGLSENDAKERVTKHLEAISQAGHPASAPTSAELFEKCFKKP